MPVKKIRALLNAASFPPTYRYAGRSIIDNNDLNARMPGIFYGAKENADFGIPQLLFCENVLPFAKGLFSVSFGDLVAAHTPATTLMDQAIVLRDADENLTLFVPAKGANYVLSHTTGLWTSKSPFSFTGELVTRAYVNGRTFVLYEGVKLVEYDAGTGILNTIALTLPVGYTIADIRGIGGAQNYLLLFTDLEVLWCAPSNILDFANTDGGAGGQIPLDLKGKITALLPVPGGFIVYSQRNAVGASYTDDATRPFVFREITNSGGVPNYERVTAEANERGHFAWTSSGLQKISLQAAETFSPEITDFLVGENYEVWNPTTKQVDLTEINGAFSVKMGFVASRYLIISYGQERNQFDGALVFDVVLERWGKLVLTHCDVFMYPYPAVGGDYFYDDLPGFYADLGENTYDDLDVVRVQVTPPKRGIAFLKNDGSVSLLNTDFTQTGANGVILIGHIQSDRASQITCHRVETENLKSEGSPVVSLLLSEEGTDFERVSTLTLSDSSDRWRKYDCREVGESFDVAIEGNFVLSGLYLDVARHGYRTT